MWRILFDVIRGLLKISPPLSDVFDSFSGTKVSCVEARGDQFPSKQATFFAALCPRVSLLQLTVSWTGTETTPASAQERQLPRWWFGFGVFLRAAHFSRFKSDGSNGVMSVVKLVALIYFLRMPKVAEIGRNSERFRPHLPLPNKAMSRISLR